MNRQRKRLIYFYDKVLSDKQKEICTKAYGDPQTIKPALLTSVLSVVERLIKTANTQDRRENLINIINEK